MSEAMEHEARLKQCATATPWFQANNPAQATFVVLTSLALRNSLVKRIACRRLNSGNRPLASQSGLNFVSCFLFKHLQCRTVTGAKPGASYGNRAAWCAYGTDKCLVFQPSRCWTQACCTCVPQVLPLLRWRVLRWRALSP